MLAIILVTLLVYVQVYDVHGLMELFCALSLSFFELDFYIVTTWSVGVDPFM